MARMRGSLFSAGLVISGVLAGTLVLGFGQDQQQPGEETAPKTDVPAETTPPSSTEPTKNTKATTSKSSVEEDGAFQQLELLTQAMEIVRKNYVDESKITYEQLIEGALEGMLSKLDPHSQYMGRRLFEDMQREQRDTSEGVGITIALRDGVLVIVAVQENGPAAKAGVMPNDEIVRIGDVLVENMSAMEAVQHLKGKAGDSVRLTVQRPGTKQLLDFHLVRAELQQSTIRDAMLLHDRMTSPWKIGYVRVTEFTQNTAEDLSKELDRLEKAGMQALVLDLRNNPGGLIDSAVAVCGEFLPDGTVVVTTEGRVPSQNPPPYRTPSRQGKTERKYPLAVLINQGSASGSELVAGALQDLKRAIIVGTTSFGKGSVQTIMPMPNGAALRLTTAKYYTPSHRTIHENGVTPNIVSELTNEEERAVMRWRQDVGKSGEVRSLDLARLGDQQLERANDVLKGLLIFGDLKTEGGKKSVISTESVKGEAKEKPTEEDKAVEPKKEKFKDSKNEGKPVEEKLKPAEDSKIKEKEEQN